MALGSPAARAAVTMADLAYRNSVNDGVLVRDRSRAKSSAAKMKPLKYGDALHICERSMTARADSMRAIILIGFSASVACRSGATCRRTSVTKVRSAAELTLGTTT